jgi:PAS domain S-box-containing protein
LKIQTNKTADANGALARARRVRFLASTFRNILLVVSLLFVFAVVRTVILWAVCNAGMQTAVTLEHQGLPALKELASLQENLALYRLDSYEYLFAQDAQKTREAKAADTIALQMRLELKNIRTLLPEGEGRQLAANLERAVDDLRAQFQKVRSLVDSDFPAAMESMDQDIPPSTERVEAAANALKEFGYQFSGAQADATFAGFGTIKHTAVIFGILNCVAAFCAFMFVLLAARRSRAQLSETLARLDERTQELGQTNGALETEVDKYQRSEKMLRESEERFSNAFELAPIGMALVALDGRWLKVNRAICVLVGYSEAELLTRTFQEITHPDDLAADLDCVRRLLAGEIRFYEMEKRYIHARGHLITVLLDVSLVRDGQNQPLYFISQIQDITERKQAEESLRLLNSAVEQSTESVIITDAELNLPGPKILFVNRAFTQMTGYAAAEVLGNTPRMFQGPRTDKAVLKRLRRNLEDGEMFAGETINYRKDGKEFDLEWQIAPIRDAGGKITHFVGIERDITARKKLENQLVQSQKMETVGKLAGGIAHEFNSILTAIIGQSELLLADLPAQSPFAKNATEIITAANRAATLTRQLLAYGRKQFLQPEILDLNQLVSGMAGMIQNLMGVGVDTQIVPAADLPTVKADVGQIEQVIINMAINARDAMPDGGKLTLETANVSLDAESVGRYSELKPGDYVMLAFTDTGMGMSDAVKARVFEPFFSTKGVGEGTGLGLSTCYGIIKQSGGHISVYSELGRGTTFKIYLPQVAAPAAISIPRLDAPDLPRGRETILLVEDNPALREMAATLLRRLGYTVFAAGNGVEALSLRHERGTGHMDLLFTDVVMPHMSGKELADQVRVLYPLTKILFTSAYTENAIVHQGVLDKGMALLQKPFTPSALAKKVREVLDQSNVPKSVDAPGKI